MEKPLRPHQELAISMVRDKLKEGNKRVVLQMPTGAGKCHAKDTRILMYDGSIKLVQDIVVGDLLMGDDSTPRTVTTLARGNEELFKITPIKGESFTVNKSHVLSLKVTPQKQENGVVNISVADYLKSTKTFKHTHKLWRTGVDFNQKQELSIPPYILGIWLGDGTRREPQITNSDKEVIKAWIDYAKSEGCEIMDRAGNNCREISIKTARGRPNPVLNKFRECDLIKNKHIPKQYLTASREDRFELLAGLLDTDGSLARNSYEITQKNNRLSKDIVFLARSLGFYCSHVKKTATIKSIDFKGEYNRMMVSGHTNLIPCRVKRKIAAKRKQKKDVLVTGFSVESVGAGDYYGFTITGNHLYLMGDFTVTHNTRVAAEIIKKALVKGNRVIFTVPAISLINQTVRAFQEEGIDSIGVLQGQHEMTNRSKMVQVCSIQTLAKRLIPDAQLILIDEAHNQFKFVNDWASDWSKVPFIGLSATPWAKGMAKTWDALVRPVTMQELIDLGYLSDFVVYSGSAPDLDGIKTTAGDYNNKELAERSDKAPLIADIVSTWKKLGNNEQTICFGTNVAHAKHIQQQFVSAGVSCEFIDAYTPMEEREDIFRRFTAGDVRVISNVGTLTTGVDLDIRCVILARATKSEMLYVQIIGRGLRAAKGKSHLIILDHSDTTKRLGFVTDIQHDELDDGRPNDSASKASKDKEERLPKPCPKCSQMKPTGVHECPGCGFKPERQNEVEHERGELVKIERKTASESRNKKSNDMQKREIYGQLKTYAKMHGYNPGWAAHKYKEFFAVWPNKYKDAPLVAVTPEVANWIKSRQIAYSKRRSA